MKRLFALMLAVVMVFALSATAFAEGDGALVGSTVRSASGKGQEAEVTITYTGEAPLSSVRFDIDSALPYASVDIAPFSEFNVDKGKIVIWAPDGEIIPDPVLVTIKYVFDDYIDNGEYPVTVKFVDATTDDQSMTLTTTDGLIIIDNDYLLGDVTLDGQVDNADLVMMARYMVNLETFNGQQMLNGDIDQDEDVDNTDLVNLAHYLVHLYEIVDKNAE